MSTETSIKASAKTASSLLAFAWIGTILASFLTNVIWQEAFGDIQTGFYVRIGITLGLLLLTFVWQANRSLRGYWLLILTRILGDIAATALQGLSAWSALWNSNPAWFIRTWVCNCRVCSCPWSRGSHSS
jgi:hypothetical protein